MIITITLETTSVQSRMISKALESVPYVWEVLNSKNKVQPENLLPMVLQSLFHGLLLQKPLLIPTVNSFIIVIVTIALFREEKSPPPSLIKL